MNLGAMLDLGVPEDYLQGELAKLQVSGWSLVVRMEQRKGITGTRAMSSWILSAGYMATMINKI